MGEQRVLLRFDTDSVAEANRWAESLRQDLLNAVPETQVERAREKEGTQDFGASLVLVLGAPAVVVLARALKSWLTRNSGAKVKLSTERGTLIAENLESKDAPDIIDAFRQVTGDA